MFDFILDLGNVQADGKPKIIILYNNTKIIWFEIGIVLHVCSSVLLQKELDCTEIITGFSSLFNENKKFFSRNVDL